MFISLRQICGLAVCGKPPPQACVAALTPIYLRLHQEHSSSALLLCIFAFSAWFPQALPSWRRREGWGTRYTAPPKINIRTGKMCGL